MYENDVRMTTGSQYAKLFTIPQDPRDKEILLAVDRKTRLDVEEKYNIIVDYDWQCNTICNCMLENIIKYLAYLMKQNCRNGVGIDFYEVIRCIVSVKTNEKAEKEGNINIVFEPGSRVENLISDGPSGLDKDTYNISDFMGETPEDQSLYATLDDRCKYDLTMYNGIIFPSHVKFFTSAITCTFIENLYRELLYRISNNNDDVDEKLESVNYNDLIEVHALMKDEKVSIRMRPGVNAKLLIKCDELTEHTMGDYEDA